MPRSSAPTKIAYDEMSDKFWAAVHGTLAGTIPAADSLEVLEADLEDLKGGGW